MIDRLGQLLQEHDSLYGVVCRDVTLTDIELMAQAGYHIVWLDLEHSPQSTEEALRLCRTITHLGMVPLVRIPELARTHVQILLDGGVQIITLPDIRSAEEAAQLVRLGKFPPPGDRGVSTSGAGTNFTLGADPQKTLSQANDATHLMVMFESDEGYAALDDILGVEGIDMVAVGQNDWAVSLGLFGEQAASLTPKFEQVLSTASKAGKITAAMASTPEQAGRFRELGVRVFIVGVDVNLKRQAFSEAIAHLQ